MSRPAGGAAASEDKRGISLFLHAKAIYNLILTFEW